MNIEAAFGIDLGGTKIEAVALTPQGEVLTRQRIDTEQGKGYEHICLRIKDLLKESENRSGCNASRLGIGTPGTWDHSINAIRGSNTLCLNGKPLLKDLEQLLGIEVRIANDANCLALAEHVAGAARDSRVTFGVVMGTGIGGGIAIDGKIWNGSQGIAGEWGHNPLETPGAECYCGKRGCVETVISGPALSRYYQDLSGETCSLKQIVEKSEIGDKNAVLTIDRLINFFAKSIAGVINLLDPDCIVLGGGVSNILRLYHDSTIKLIKEHVFSPSPTVTLRQNQLGDSAGVIGAALL